MSSGAFQVTLWVPFNDLLGPSHNYRSASLKTHVPLEAPSDLCGVPVDHSGALRHLPLAPSHLLEAPSDLGVPYDPKGTSSDLPGVWVTPLIPK